MDRSVIYRFRSKKFVDQRSTTSNFHSPLTTDRRSTASTIHSVSSPQHVYTVLPKIWKIVTVILVRQTGNQQSQMLISTSV